MFQSLMYELNRSAKTPVTVLQEYMSKKNEVPQYELICNGVGTHEAVFKYEVSASGYCAIGTGRSKKEAKQESARLLLELLSLGVSQNNEVEQETKILSPYEDTLKENMVGALQAFCGDNRLPDPTYQLIQDTGPAHSKIFTMKCSVSTISYNATARTKKQAKHRSAAGLLEKLKLSVAPFINIPDEEEEENSILRTVMQRLEETGVRSKLKESTISLGDLYKDMYKHFKTSHTTCDSLNEFRNILRKDIRELENPEENILKIAQELNFELKFIVMPSHDSDLSIVSLSFIAKPGWTFLGTGVNLAAAKRNAYYSALEFLFDMSK